MTAPTTCRDVGGYCGDEAEVRRDDVARAAVRGHLAGCPACATAFGPDLALWDALADPPPETAPPFVLRRKSRFRGAWRTGLVLLALLFAAARAARIPPPIAPAPPDPPVARVRIAPPFAAHPPVFTQAFTVERPAARRAPASVERRVSRPRTPPIR